VFERFTAGARRVLFLAQEEARLLEHRFIGTEHILLALIREQDGVAAKALESLGVSLIAARAVVEEKLGTAGGPLPSAPPFTPRAKNVLELSLREALQLGHDYIGTEHLLLGLVREGEGVGAQVLVSLGADPVQVRRRVLSLLGASATGPGAGPLATTEAFFQPFGRTKRREAQPHVALGQRWSAEVVVAGRRPEDFADAYDQLGDLARRLGLHDLDAERLHLSSVDTDLGPGLRLSIAHSLPTDTGLEGDRPADAPAGEGPGAAGPSTEDGGHGGGDAE
jgi:hypothetical protein